jgi:cytochrome c oxidase cbb3-type subunit III
MNPHPQQPPPGSDEDALRPHTYDGIQEYDKRLPNWWLYTLYGTIAFWIVYWFAHEVARIVPSDGDQVDAAMARIAATKMASSIDVTNDDLFMQCHLVSLRGKAENPAAVGPDLTDTAWIHGGTPKEIYHTVAQGVLVKGMPAWEPVLGQKKTAEVVAYLLTRHQKGDPITVEVSK